MIRGSRGFSWACFLFLVVFLDDIDDREDRNEEKSCDGETDEASLCSEESIKGDADCPDRNETKKVLFNYRFVHVAVDDLHGMIIHSFGGFVQSVGLGVVFAVVLPDDELR